MTSRNANSRNAFDEVEIAAILPCFNVAASVDSVLRQIGPEVSTIFCVDDCSTDETFDVLTEASLRDPRVRLLRRKENGGVGAATIDGYRRALSEGQDILVKLDADGQMDPSMIPDLALPIALGDSDYVKGNRFFSTDTLRQMPPLRILGNAGVSYLSKFSSGYWQLFDPTNGFTALHANLARALPLEKLHTRYFFESDMLFRLYLLRAHVLEWPMHSIYGEETSHLNEVQALAVFSTLHLRNASKRIVYTYFLRNFSMASANLIVGTLLVLSSSLFGITAWVNSYTTGVPATAGTVMLSALPFLIGVQLVLSFLAYDMTMVPDDPIHDRVARTTGATCRDQH